MVIVVIPISGAVRLHTSTRSLEKRGNVQAAVSRLKTFTSALQVKALMMVIGGGNVGVI